MIGDELERVWDIDVYVKGDSDSSRALFPKIPDQADTPEKVFELVSALIEQEAWTKVWTPTKNPEEVVKYVRSSEIVKVVVKSSVNRSEFRRGLSQIGVSR